MGRSDPDSASAKASHDVRVAATVILVVSATFGWSCATSIPGAAAGSMLLGIQSLWLYRTRSRPAAIAVFAWALLGAVLAVLWTAEGRVAGGHIVLMSLFVLWAAQRALEAASRPAPDSR